MMNDFFIPFLIAILSGMGVGGGGLLVIYLSLLKEVAQIEAQGINLCFFIISAIASTLFNVKQGKINLTTTLIVSAFGIAFSIFGTLLAGEINAELLKKIFAGMLILGGASSLLSSFFKKNRTQNI